MLRLIHNRFIGKFLAVIIGLMGAAYFAWGFWYFGEWLGHTFLETLPFNGGPTLLAILCSALMFCAVLYTYFYAEYTKEEVQAYEDDRGDGSFIKAFYQMKRGVFFLECFSLVFRLIMLNFSTLSIALVGIGLALLWLMNVFGKVLHAQINVPHDVAADRTMNDAGNRVWQRAPSLLKKMSPSQLRRLAAGDHKSLDEVDRYGAAEREREVTKAEQRRIEAQARRDKAKKLATNYLKPEDPADIISSNGKQPSNFN
jgi:hypothetical protein